MAMFITFCCKKLFLKRRRAGHATLSSNHYLASQGVSFTFIFALKRAICISFHFRIINRLINAKLNHREMRFARRLRVFELAQNLQLHEP